MKIFLGIFALFLLLWSLPYGPRSPQRPFSRRLPSSNLKKTSPPSPSPSPKKRWEAQMKKNWTQWGIGPKKLQEYQKLHLSFEQRAFQKIEAMEGEQSYRITGLYDKIIEPLREEYEKHLINLIGKPKARLHLKSLDSFNESLSLDQEIPF